MARPSAVEQCRRPRPIRIVPVHDRLAATLVEPGHRRLQRHRFREAERVGQRVGVVLVVAEAHAPQRRPERGRVHGDHRAQSRLGIGDEHHLLVTVAGHELGDGTAPDRRHQRAVTIVTVARGARSVPCPPTRYPRCPMTTAAASDTAAGNVPTELDEPVTGSKATTWALNVVLLT